MDSPESEVIQWWLDSTLRRYNIKANANLQWKWSSSGSAPESLCPPSRRRDERRKVDYLTSSCFWSMNCWIIAFLNWGQPRGKDKMSLFDKLDSWTPPYIIYQVDEPEHRCIQWTWCWRLWSKESHVSHFYANFQCDSMHCNSLNFKEFQCLEFSSTKPLTGSMKNFYT